jgi:hypothetical protein
MTLEEDFSKSIVSHVGVSEIYNSQDFSGFVHPHFDHLFTKADNLEAVFLRRY